MVIDNVPCLQFITMHDSVVFFSLGSQRGTTSEVPVFLYTDFAHASHTRASSGRCWTICSPTHVAGFLYTLAGESEEQRWHLVELLCDRLATVEFLLELIL